MWSHVVSLFRRIVTRHFVKYPSCHHLIELILAPFPGQKSQTSRNSLDLLCKLHEDLHSYKISTCNQTLVLWPGLAVPAPHSHAVMGGQHKSLGMRPSTARLLVQDRE